HFEHAIGDPDLVVAVFCVERFKGVDREAHVKTCPDSAMQSAIRCPYFQKAFAWSVPIGGLAGLVGLGGGEFRLPVLMYVVGYPARMAVPLNLARRCAQVDPTPL